MSISIWMLTAVMVLHMAQSYILLTANIEDVRNIARQVAESPVADRMSKIVHRAWQHFKPHLNKMSGKKILSESEDEVDDRRRTDDKKKKRFVTKDSGSDGNRRVRRRDQGDAADDLESSESYYRKSIDKIFDEV